jgi:hypothetical protein
MAEVETFIQHTNGKLVAYYINGLRLDIGGEPHLLGIGIDISARKTAEDALHATMARLARPKRCTRRTGAQAPLCAATISRPPIAPSPRSPRARVGVSRVGIWFYNDANTAMQCADLFVQPTGQHEAGLEISACDYPIYFAALAEGRVLPAHSARNDAHTHEFAV